MTGEDERVERWHYECFHKLDLAIGTINTLIAWGTEPRQVAELVEAGCPEDTMLRIVQPLDDPVVIPEPEYSVSV